jgi:Transposase, Mutator family
VRYPCVAVGGIGPRKKDLCDDRGLAQSVDGGRTPVRLGIVVKRSWAGEVRNVSLLVAIGVNAEGYREILGICEGAKEDKAGWSSFLKHLKERGLTGVRLIISDACIGLAESVAEFFPDAAWQRCIVGLLNKRAPSCCQPLQINNGGGQIGLNAHVREAATDRARQTMQAIGESW